jgi:hypothetical protein
MKTFRWIFAVAVLVAWWPIPMAATQSDSEPVHRTRAFTSPAAVVDVNGPRQPSLATPLAAIPVIIALRFL